MARRSHGGSCCGINHSVGYSLGGSAVRIRNEIRRDKTGLANGMLLEIVVTDSQLRGQRCLGPILAEEGFKLVSRFRNPNSRNNVNVFHFSTAMLPIENRPFSLDPEQAPKPAAPVPVQGEAGNWRRLRWNEAIPNNAVLRVHNPRLVTHGRIIQPGTWHYDFGYMHLIRVGRIVYRRKNLQIQVR